jgi:hypothetical protein
MKTIKKFIKGSLVFVAVLTFGMSMGSYTKASALKVIIANSEDRGEDRRTVLIKEYGDDVKSGMSLFVISSIVA